MSLIGCNSGNTLCLHQQTQSSDSLITLEAKVDRYGWAGFGVGNKEPGSTLYAFWKKDGKCRVSSWRLRAPWQGESDTYSYISMENIASNFSISNRAVGANLQCTVRLPKKIPNINQNFTWATGTLSPDSLFERNDGFLGSPDESGKLILNNVASISKLSIFAVLAALMIL